MPTNKGTGGSVFVKDFEGNPNVKTDVQAKTIEFIHRPSIEGQLQTGTPTIDPVEAEQARLANIGEAKSVREQEKKILAEQKKAIEEGKPVRILNAKEAYKEYVTGPAKGAEDAANQVSAEYLAKESLTKPIKRGGEDSRRFTTEGDNEKVRGDISASILTDDDGTSNDNGVDNSGKGENSKRNENNGGSGTTNNDTQGSKTSDKGTSGISGKNKK